MIRTLTAAETEAAHEAAESVSYNATDTFGMEYDAAGHVLNNRDEVLCVAYDSGDFDHWRDSRTEAADDDAIWAEVVAFMNK